MAIAKIPNKGSVLKDYLQRLIALGYIFRTTKKAGRKNWLFSFLLLF
ncbi:hypothetical protein RFW18_19370 [Metabacillus idriensis]|nr:hypothetical protein [Metabacillus idriensis]MDR0139922.1 hypothetical protein [Metabacillus idriensis]